MRKRTSCVDQTWIWISPPYTSVIAYAFSFPFLSAYDYACALAAVWHNCNNNNDDDYRSTLIFANLSHKRFGPAQFNCLRSHFSILSPLTITVFCSLILLMRTNVSILPFQMRHQIYIRGCVCSSVRHGCKGRRTVRTSLRWLLGSSYGQYWLLFRTRHFFEEKKTKTR